MRDNRTYTVYTHRVVTEDNGPMYYVGVTTNVKQRWQPNKYNGCSLWPYIEKYGWDNIRHSLVAEDLDRETALKLEDTLIQMFSAFQCCINKHRSGCIEIDDPLIYFREYSKQYRKEHVEEVKAYKDAYNAKYFKEHREEIMLKRREYEESEHGKSVRHAYNISEQGKANNRKYQANRRSKPEWKIYTRVRNFNAYYPDRATETPLEAKRKYIESGGTIIPQYIKHDDL